MKGLPGQNKVFELYSKWTEKSLGGFEKENDVMWLYFKSLTVTTKWKTYYREVRSRSKDEEIYALDQADELEWQQ